MTYFICQSEFSVSRDSLFNFHESPEGFQTLVGQAKGVEIVSRPQSLAIGEIAILKVPILPLLKVKWIAKHIGYEKNVFFKDIQVKGPFPIFSHEHKFKSLTPTSSILTDQIELRFWFWPISRWFILPMLKKQFITRHQTTAKFLKCESKLMFCGYSISVID